MSENGGNALQPMQILNLGQLVNLVTHIYIVFSSARIVTEE